MILIVAVFGRLNFVSFVWLLNIGLNFSVQLLQNFLVGIVVKDCFELQLIFLMVQNLLVFVMFVFKMLGLLVVNVVFLIGVLKLLVVMLNVFFFMFLLNFQQVISFFVLEDNVIFWQVMILDCFNIWLKMWMLLSCFLKCFDCVWLLLMLNRVG